MCWKKRISGQTINDAYYSICAQVAELRAEIKELEIKMHKYQNPFKFNILDAVMFYHYTCNKNSRIDVKGFITKMEVEKSCGTYFNKYIILTSTGSEYSIAEQNILLCEDKKDKLQINEDSNSQNG